MKFKNPFLDLSRFEKILYIISVVVVTASYLIPNTKDYLTLAASLIGVTALIFVAKGYLLGEVLTIAFSVFYGIISFYFNYYGEMITYLLMTTPMAVIALVSWAKNPYKKTKEVTVKNLKKRDVLLLFIFTFLVTILFYFILKALNTANLIISTISVTTSFSACFLTYQRSPYYAIGYALNDIVLIILWVLATVKQISYLPMVFCFIMFLFNDLYGFFNWKRMQKRQSE